MKNDSYANAIEAVMRDNGGFAPLKLLYRDIWKHKNRDKVHGKTPDNTIQEKCHRGSRFYRIGKGVYALEEFRGKLEAAKAEPSPQSPEERTHARIQGMLLEIGNCLDFDTYTPDQSALFDGKPLRNLATLKQFPPFTFNSVVVKVSRIDVIWFNKFGFPKMAFEVEHTTKFSRALQRFSELQEFQTQFFCVAQELRRSKFETERESRAFEAIAERCEFRAYDKVESAYQERDVLSFP